MRGSPPLTRGIREFACSELGGIRFTPAHAGNTKKCIEKQLWMKVHPRSRGEYHIFLLSGYDPVGSPPLTRGIHP